MFLYVFNDLRSPESGIITTSVRQLDKRTGMGERALGNKLKNGACYYEPSGLFQVLRLELHKDRRSSNGNVDNFKKKYL